MKFRYDMTIKYLNLMKDKIEEGRRLQKKIMVREAIRYN